MFRSEFGEDGDVGEIDYSQLEVVTKTALSGDPVMKADLQAGVCQHCVNLAFAEDMPYEEVYRLCKIENDPVWDAKRSDIKPFTFSEKYGGGAKSISEKTGIPIKKLEKIIAERKERYNVEAAFDERVLSEVRRSLTTSPFRTAKGAPAGVGYYFCVTGTVYAFIEDDAPKWLQDRDGVKTAIKPTQTKNYPSQGLGGFIMEDALGSIFRWMVQVPEIWDYVKLRNTVHDCMWTDTHKEFTGVVLPFFKAIMEDVPWRFVRMFGELGWDLKFPAEAEVGPNMLELHHLK